MGTHGAVIINDDDGRHLVTVLFQSDGYPDGAGREIAEFLTPFEITSGITGQSEMGKSANGMQCLAAQVVKHFKERVGGVYIVPKGSLSWTWQYTIDLDDDGKTLHMTVKEGRKFKWEGPITEFKAFLDAPEPEEPIRVIFRKWKGKEGEVIALFPDTYGEPSSNPGLMQSYMHVGQHSEAKYDVVMAGTRPAKPEEFADLLAELKGLGYTFVIAKRFQRPRR